MAVEPLNDLDLETRFALIAPDRSYAEKVVSWVRDDRELHWLAPRTLPPLSAAKVLGWRKQGRRPLLLVERETGEVAGYAELNLLDGSTSEYWLGHIVVDPARRGQGLGVVLTRLLIRKAFDEHAARRVSLVVFPDNEPAIRCYVRAGMHEDGYEVHRFRGGRGRERLTRFAINKVPTA